MQASIQPAPRNLPVGLGTVIWLAAFLSPSAYFFLLLFANRFQISVPQTIVASLFFLIPVVALIVCESVVWSCSKTMGRKIAWMLFTFVAMLIQFGVILVVLRQILIAAISYAQ